LPVRTNFIERLVRREKTFNDNIHGFKLAPTESLKIDFDGVELSEKSLS